MAVTAQSVRITGELRQWHRVELTMDGPSSSESATPNPFLDYRLRVEFAHAATNRRYLVPGFFAADGDAANTGATAGSRWRVRFAPDQVGTWTYRVSFRTGTRVAIDETANAGRPLAPFDGVQGRFTIAASDKTGRDHRAKGRLDYVGRHHLRFANGEWLFKVGADSPENLLAYDDFDNTPDNGGRRKAWAPHVQDWRAGDPTWRGGRGKGLIGALNYLASEDLNVVSFLTYSHNGDDKNISPYVNPNAPVRFDCSKLAQWEIALDHADRRGLYLHFKTQETENDQDLDGGALGVERRLYYRELVARFGHHLALNWNLGEENTNTDAQRKAFAAWFRRNDPYRHPVVIHTYPGQKNAVYGPMLGSASELVGASLQSGAGNVFADTRTWRQRSANAGKPWVVANDEQGNANTGILPDSVDPTHDGVRRDVLWGHLTAGGAGIECYFGYAHPHSDLTCEDWRSRDLWWDQCRYARDFLRAGRVPFQDMANDDARLGNAPSKSHCLAGARFFAIYLSDANSAVTVDLADQPSQAFEVLWFDPRNGGAFQTGSVTAVTGGARRALGTAPGQPGKDWVVLVRPQASRGVLRSYGAGCPGTGGRVPAMAGQGLPWLGAPEFAVQVRQGRPLADAAFLIGGTSDRLPLGASQCTLWVGSPLSQAARTDAAGQATLPLPIPVDAGLLNRSLFVSAAIRDPNGAFAGLVSVAGGLEARIGY